MLLDYITNEPIADNAKDQVRQRIARALFHEYGISVDDMEPDFRLKIDGRAGAATDAVRVGAAFPSRSPVAWPDGRARK